MTAATPMEADHQPALMHHRHVAQSGCCRLVITCRGCNRSRGTAEGNRQRGEKAKTTGKPKPSPRVTTLIW